mgnify:CR=1 FL=1
MNLTKTLIAAAAALAISTIFSSAWTTSVSKLASTFTSAMSFTMTATLRHRSVYLMVELKLVFSFASPTCRLPPIT